MNRGHEMSSPEEERSSPEASHHEETPPGETHPEEISREDKAPAHKTRRFKRKLTTFLCQEMLFDYATDRLDFERRIAIEEFLDKDKECQQILEGIRWGLEYTERLATTALKPEIIAQLRESENAFSIGRRYSVWSAWPETFRWSVTAIAISAIVAVVVALVPWTRFRFLNEQKSDTIEIAQIPGARIHVDLNDTESNSAAATVATTTESSGDLPPGELDEGSGDEHADHDHGRDHAITLEERPPVVAAHPPSKPVAVAPPPPSSPPPRSTLPSVLASRTAAPIDASAIPTLSGSGADPGAEEAASASEGSDRKEFKARGYVFRAFMTLSNLEEIGPKITEHIKELGGEKAGEVELGWKRGTGRYYHFSLPEVNEEKILERLRAYGPVRISKDPHPRVMPQGQLRFILWIEAAN